MTASRPDRALRPQDMLSVEDALRRILALCDPLPRTTLALEAAAGHVLADDVPAPFDIPPPHNTAPDGAVGPGEAVRIMTGAPLPPGADAVVPFEETDEAGLQAPGQGQTRSLSA